MASSFAGRHVEVTLNGGQVVIGTITSVDPVQQTLSIASDHHTLTWPKTQIASLSLREPPAAPVVIASESSSLHHDPSASNSAPAAKPALAPASAPAPVPSEQHESAASAPVTAASATMARVPARTPVPASASRPKTPGTSRLAASSRPESATRDRKKSKAKKAVTNSPKPNYAPGAPAPNPNPVGFSDDFDFDSALGKFDKQKAFADFRNADKSDPAQLLVSHNKATPGLIQLVRGPNGVGPVPQSPAASHTRGAQDKLGLHEPVLSPPASEHSFPVAASASRSASRSASHSRSHRVEDAEKDELRARVALLEALSGLSVSAAPPVEGLGKRARTYHVTTWRDHVAQSTAETDPQQSEGQLQFTAAAISAPSKDVNAAKLLVRYLGVNNNRSHSQVFDAIPDKYHRSFTLRPQTASIFVRRLRAAAFPDAEG